MRPFLHAGKVAVAATILIVSGSVASGITDAGGATPSSLQTPAASDLPRTVVSVGDSFIAGEGGRWAGNSNGGGNAQGTDRSWRSNWLWSWPDPYRVYGPTLENGCHRSDVAPVTWIDSGEYDAQINLACSGATTKHVIDTGYKWQPPQSTALRQLTATHNVDAVLVSVGGNNLANGGFSELVIQCVLSYGLDLGDCRHGSSHLPGVEETVAANLEAAVQGIRDSVRAIEDALVDDVDGYRIVLMNPVSPVPEAIDAAFVNRDARTWTGRCPFTEDDMRYISTTLVPQVIAPAWSAVAAELDIEFVNMSEALAGKEMCAPGTTFGKNPATAQWFRFISINPLFGEVFESAHPNALGQQAIGTCFALHLAQTANQQSECVRNGETPSDMTLGSS